MDYLDEHIKNTKTILNRLQMRMDVGNLNMAAHTMAQCKGTIYVAGFVTSYSLAHLFWITMTYLRNRVVLIDNSPSSSPHQLVNLTKDDCLFGITWRRYSSQTYKIAKLFHKANSKIILLIDRELSPFTEFDAIQLVAPMAHVSMFESNCGRLSIIETLIRIIISELGDKINEHAEACEEIYDLFSFFIDKIDAGSTGRS